VRSAVRFFWRGAGADLIEAGLNEGAAGFARGYGDCIFTRRRMSSLGVVVNGAQSLPRRDEQRRAPWKRLAALVMAALANPRACGFIAGGGDRDESLGRSGIVAQIIEASLMTCRSEMAAWEHGVAERRQQCAR
jgi:hypothetical protein